VGKKHFNLENKKKSTSKGIKVKPALVTTSIKEALATILTRKIICFGNW
jgi:hypothetical protein